MPKRKLFSRRFTDLICRLSLHFVNNIPLILFSSLIFSAIFCLLFCSGSFYYFLNIFLLKLVFLIVLVLITGAVFFHEIELYINLLDLSASSNIRKITTEKTPTYSALFDSSLFIASFFQKIFSRLSETEAALLEESNKLEDVSVNLYSISRYQQGSIGSVRSSSERIDQHVNAIAKKITNIERQTEKTQEKSSIIEGNSSEINTLLGDLINFIQNAKDILKRAETSFAYSNNIVESINGFASNTADNMEDLKETSNSVYDTILSTLEYQRDVFTRVQHSQRTVDEYSKAINSIKENLNTTVEIINFLKEHSEEINGKLTVINKISKQTNLLSLNANIIAASSGEESKSFSVVADEIHALSKKTQKSTAEIAGIISNIGKSITKSSEASENSITIVDRTQQYGNQVNKNLGSILNNAQSSIRNIETIKDANLQQLNAIEKAVEKIRLSSEKIILFSNCNNKLQNEFRNLKDLSVDLVDITNGLNGRMSLQLTNTRSLTSGTNDIAKLINKIIDISSSIKVQSDTMLKSFVDIRETAGYGLITVKDLTAIAYQIHNEHNRIRSLTEYFIPFAPKKGGCLRVYFPPIDAGFSYDPVLCHLIEAVPLFNGIYETLVETRAGFIIKPLLCEKYTISENHKEFEFQLKDNVFFHNGKPLKAFDVKYSYERLKYINIEKAESLLSPISGYREFADEKSDGLSGIKVIDDLTLRITLDKPIMFFLHILSTVAMSIVPYSNKPEIKSPVGTGAFKFAGLDKNRNIILEKYDGYHQHGLPYVDRVCFVQTSVQEYFHGTYHIVPGHKMPSGNIFADINILVNTKTKMHSEILDPNSISYLILNTKVRPFDIKEVRQAVMLSIDRERLTEDVFYGINKKAECILPQNIFSHFPRKDIVRHDLNHAKHLLKLAGIKTPVKLPYYTTSERFQDPAVSYTLDCIKETGLEIEHIFTKPQDYTLKKYESAMTMMIWFADYPDPDNFFTTFYSNNIDGRGIGWVNEEYGMLIKDARYESDIRRRQDLYYRAQEILLDEAVIIPLYYNKYLLFHHHDVIFPVKTIFPFYDTKTCWFYNRKDEK